MAQPFANQPGMSSHDVMQVCRRGHMITALAGSGSALVSEHCSDCGASTVIACEHCKATIRGFYVVDEYGYGGVAPDHPPSFCHNCGKPHPWTDERLQAAREYAAEVDELSPDERVKLAESFQDIVSDNPRTNLAVTRIKKYMVKVGKPVGEALYKAALDVASDAVKKLLMAQ